MQPVEEAIPASRLNESQRKEVLAQLELLLASSLFRQSKRYPAFLRYVVESTLEGSDEDLKERTIGIEVFGRVPNYDTSQDPTVRLTAAEVRKRLAQYYQRPEHAESLHIAMHPGSYVPAFSWPSGTLRHGSESEFGHNGVSAIGAELPEVVPVAIEKAGTAKARANWPWWWVAAVVAGILAIGYTGFFVYRHQGASAGAVWDPLLRDPNAVSLILPDVSKSDLVPQPQENDKTSVLAHIRNNRLVDFNDSIALAQLSGLLGRWNKPYSVLLSSESTFEELQAGPTILIGAVDNPWTMRFLEPLPYSVMRKGDSLTYAIMGKQRATQPDWSIDLMQPFEKLQQDYGIVAREMDTMTGRPVLIVAGLGQNGTTAGIRLLSDPVLEREITEAAPKGWSGRNLEVVFRTQIIDDKFGPPVILAREYW
jgi:hypothetical protein